jgi:amino acid adenylation domain-containing protein
MWQGGEAPEGIDCVHERISKYSQRAPQHVAVISGEKQITYGELNYRANQLARYLVAQGAAPDTLVAVHLKRSVELLVAVLAVLKSGAAFLPLDVSLPAGRITGILKASQSPIVLTTSNLAGPLGELGATTILMDANRDAWRNESGEDFASPSEMHHLAYTTYTSGSTGTPKGVMIEHRNVVSSFAGIDSILGTKPGVWLASTSISFDIAVTELLWTLSRGFKLVIHEGDEGVPVLSGPHSIAAEICRYGVTHLQGTPTLARMILTDPAAPAALAKLKKLILGGEPFPPSLASTLLEVMTGDFYNVYGPTETTICATADLVCQVQDPLPIGPPLGNTLAYVLDEHGRILPPLAQGELFIGGPTVGRGYFRRHDLTAERFIPDPFSGIRGGRLYRTGDLVRRRLNGKLEFIDRLDSQVKIRGYRIELGEIEAVLRTLPAIEDAVVVVRGEASAEKTLAGFFTLRPGARASLEEVSGYLKQLLPSYMVPPSLTLLQALPLNSNGKTDRAKLAAMAPSASVRTSVVTEGPEIQAPPSDPKLQEAERALCAWCSELLKVPDVTPTMDFFEIGGQSLAAAQLMHRISKSYGAQIRLSTLIKVRTMRGLAALALREADGPSQVGPSSPVVEVRAAGTKEPLFLIAGLGGNVVNFELLSRGLADDRPIYAIETRGTSRNLEILSTIEDMAEAYLEEVRRIQPTGPYYLCGYSFGGVIAFEMAQQLAAAGEELGMVGMIDTPEWHYTQRVMNSFNLLTRLRVLYGGAVRRVLFGPERKAALRKRINAASTKCRVAYDHLRGRHLEAAIASSEQRNLRALMQYTPKYYSGEIHFFRCPDPSLDRGADPLLGWGDLARHVTVSEIPGEHGSLTVEPYVGFLARALHQSLDSLETRVARKPKATRVTRAGEMAKPLVASI